MIETWEFARQCLVCLVLGRLRRVCGPQRLAQPVGSPGVRETRPLQGIAAKSSRIILDLAPLNKHSARRDTLKLHKGPTVEEHATRQSILLRFYHRYLSDSDTARFIASVAGRYSVASLERLVQSGDVYTRRAAALALGLIGNSSSNMVLGPFLKSSDRKLRLVVDDALRAIWMREGTDQLRQSLERIVRLNECGEFERAIELATQAIDTLECSPELLHQRSLALFQLDETERAIQDCIGTLQLNPYHYPAMIGLGHCYIELADLPEALHWFRQAVEVYPDLEPVRLQIQRLERTMKGL